MVGKKAKKKEGRRRSDPDFSDGQNDHPKADEKLAKEFNVSLRTICRYAKFAEAVDRLSEEGKQYDRESGGKARRR